MESNHHGDDPKGVFFFFFRNMLVISRCMEKTPNYLFIFFHFRDETTTLPQNLWGNFLMVMIQILTLRPEMRLPLPHLEWVIH